MGLIIDDKWSSTVIPKNALVTLLNYGLRDLVLVEWEGYRVLIYEAAFHERTVRLAK